MKLLQGDGLRRILIWLAVALGLIGAGIVYTKLTFRSFEAQARETLREQQRAGTLPRAWKGIDVETVNIWNLGMQMRAPREWETRLQIALLLADFWYVWVVVVLVVCLIAAALPSRRRKAPRNPTASRLNRRPIWHAAPPPIPPRKSLTWLAAGSPLLAASIALVARRRVRRLKAA